jgi:hypothetical protein
MITITVTSEKDFAFARAAMEREVLRNPNLNGEGFVVQRGDYNGIDGDALICEALWSVVFAQDEVESCHVEAGDGGGWRGRGSLLPGGS